jgi:hypothetical protein
MFGRNFVKESGFFRRRFRDQIHLITDVDQFKQFFYIVISHPDAPVRRGVANGFGVIGSVQAIAFEA